MIETYKILAGKEDTKWNRFFQMAPERGDPDLARGLKLFPKRPWLDKRKYVFSYRVIQKWNDLSKEEVQARKSSGFKAKYDKNAGVYIVLRFLIYFPAHPLIFFPPSPSSNH